MIYTKRRKRAGTKAFGGIFFEGSINAPTLLLELEDDSTIQLGNAFIVDAIEFYLEHVLTLGVLNYAIEKRKVTKNNKSKRERNGGRRA